MRTEHVYKGHNGSNDLKLYADNQDGAGAVAQDLSNVTKITLSLDTFLISSTDPANGDIRWAQGGYDTGEIRMFLGTVTNLPVGDFRDAPLVVYDATNTDGIVWDEIPIYVHDEVEAS